MPLQVRRGTNAQRQILTVPLASGELLWVTDTQQLFIGDGVTLANALTPVVGYNDENAQDAVGPMFDHANHTDISFTYNDGAGRIDAVVSLSAFTQNVDMSTFNLSGSGNITTTGTVTAGSYIGDYRGSIFGDDSTLLVDAVNNNIPAQNLLGTATIDIIGNVTGNVTGNLTGDIKGSIFSDDSTLLVNAVDSSINLDGTVKGNIIPDANEAYDLGSGSARFKDLYLSGSSIFLGDAVINATGTTVNLPAGSTINGEPLGPATFAGTDLNVNIIGDDSTVIIDSSNREGTFTSVYVPTIENNVDTLTIKSTALQHTRFKGLVTTGGTNTVPTVEIYSVRNSIDTDDELQNTDYTGALKFTIPNGVDNLGKTIAQIRSQVVAQVNDDAPLGVLEFIISAGGTSYKTFSFAGDGTAEFSGAIKTGVYNNDADRDSNITFPQEGHICFNKRDDSTGVPVFQGYDGNNWVDLH